MPLGESDDHLLLLVDKDNIISNSGCNTVASTEKTGEPTPGDTITSGAVCVVDVLVMVTPAAKAQDPTIVNRIYQAEYQGAEIFSHSEVANVKYRIIGVEDCNLAEAINDTWGDQIRIWSVDPTLISRRNSSKADLVVIITKDAYSRANGQAQDVGIHPSIAFCLVEAGNAISSRFTMNHELGHLIGLRHDTAKDHRGSYNHGKNFKITRGFFGIVSTYSTLMSIVGENRLSYLSNPDVSWRGHMLGSTTVENNARMARGTFCTVHNYKNGAWPMTVDLGGPSYPVCPCNNYSIFANIDGDFVTPLTYKWYESEDGVNYTLTASGGTSRTVTKPCPYTANDPVYVKLVVTDANNQRVEDIWVDLPGTGHRPACPQRLGIEMNTMSILVEDNGLQNPVLKVINWSPHDAATISLIDLQGRNIPVIGKEVGNDYVVNFAHLPAGLYNISITVRSVNKSTRVLKIQN